MTALQDERAALLRAIETVPSDALPALRQMVELFSQALAHQRERERVALSEELHQEMADWDAASDEALLEFDKQMLASES